MRRPLLTIGLALLAGTACRGVRPAAPAQPIAIEHDSTYRTLSLSELCVEHPHALTRLADRCGFIIGTTRGALAERHPAVARWTHGEPWLPNEKFEPKRVTVMGREQRYVSLAVMSDSLVPYLYEGVVPTHYTIPTARAPLVTVSRSATPPDTGALRAELAALERGVQAAGGVLIECRRPLPARDSMPNWQRTASWQVGRDVVTLFARLDTVETLDTLQTRWAIERHATLRDAPPRVERGCVTPARADWTPFVRAASVGYDTPLRGWFRLRTLALACEATRRSGTPNHPRCAGVPPADDFIETLGPDGMPTGARRPRPPAGAP